MQLDLFNPIPEKIEPKKVCNKCGVEKDLGEFKIHRAKCKACVNKLKIIYRNNNKEKIKEYNANYRETNKEKINALISNYRETNKEKIKLKDRDYKKTNKDKIKEYKSNYREINKEKIKDYRLTYYNNNKEKAKDYRLTYYNNNRKIIREKYTIYKRNKLKTDLKYRIGENIRSRILKAIKRNSKSSSTFELLGCDIETVKKHIENQFQIGMTWENYGFYSWHIDHIIPCASFDLTNPEEQKKCFHYTNLQPLWWKDNIIKAAKII